MAKRFIITVPKTGGWDLTTLSNRQKVADLVSSIINAGYREDLPYPFSKGDEHNFVLDANNNWWFHCCGDDPKSFYIQHRYANTKAVEAISNWINFHLFNDTGRVTEVDV